MEVLLEKTVFSGEFASKVRKDRQEITNVDRPKIR